MIGYKATNYKRDDLIFPTFLYFELTVWVSHDTATDEEKISGIDAEAEIAREEKKL